MSDVGYNDSHELNSIASFLLPSRAELALLLLLSLIIVGLGNFHLIWQSFTNASNVSQQDVSQTLQPQLNYINNYFQQDIFGQIAGILVWGVVGSIVYAIIWGGQHAYSRTKDDISQSGNIQSVSSKSYWRSKAEHYFYFACSWLVLSGFMLAFFTKLLPLSKRLVQNGGYLHIILAVGSIMIGLYLLVRLWRAASYIFRVTY